MNLLAMEAQSSAALLNDPGLFLHQIDPVLRRALIIRILQTDLAHAAFLDERILQTQRETTWHPLSGLPQFSMADAPERYIFHIGHCGSTLLSRLLDLWPDTLGLREPLVLRRLAELQEQAMSPFSRFAPQELQTLQVNVLGLLGRRFSSGQRIVIKATSCCNALIAPLLQLSPNAKLLLLSISLDAYLATVLKAPGARRDALTFAPARLAWLHRILQSDQLRLYQLDEAEIIALGWLAELSRFAAFADHPNALAVDFDSFLAQPGDQLECIAKFFDLPGDAATVEQALSSPLRGRYSKATDHAYDAEDRQHDLELSRSRFRTEIAQGLSFVENLLTKHPALSSLGHRIR